jgi:16S rRNA (cytosine967-C5)-methyltransferase
MQQRAKIKATIDMLDAFFQSFAPFDILMAKFFRQNKWIGSNDRREIAEFSYAIFRNYETIKFYLTNITTDFGYFFVLVFLKAVQKLSNDEIFSLFSGKSYGPPRLGDFARKFITSIDLSGDLPLNARLNYPIWMEPYLLRAFSGDLTVMAEEMKALNAKAQVDLRVNRLKASREEAKKLLLLSKLDVEETKYASNGLRILNGRIGRNHRAIADGIVEIQDEGSQLLAEICGAKPGDRVIDYCAGAGGKTLAIAAAMENRGRIFALDKYPERLKNAQARCKRSGVNNVLCQAITPKWIKRHTEWADVVLVDAPCSGTGTWRRNPEMRAKFSLSALEELLETQAAILRSAQKLVKKGGRFIYATCSILKEENEDQIENFVREFPDFELLPISAENVGATTARNVGSADDGFCEHDLYFRLRPAKHRTDGFFAAILRRKL